MHAASILGVNSTCHSISSHPLLILFLFHTSSHPRACRASLRLKHLHSFTTSAILIVFLPSPSRCRWSSLQTALRPLRLRMLKVCLLDAFTMMVMIDIDTLLDYHGGCVSLSLMASGNWWTFVITELPTNWALNFSLPLRAPSPLAHFLIRRRHASHFTFAYTEDPRYSTKIHITIYTRLPG